MAKKSVTIEDIPEFDAIEGIVSPRLRDTLFGQNKAEKILLDAYRSARLHHAWLISGEKGTGKATLAWRFARFVLSNPNPASDHVQKAETLHFPIHEGAATQVAHGAHPDLLLLSRRFDFERKKMTQGIPVDDVRRILPFFGSTAGAGGWRICLIDAVDDMNASAANAILKMLEEPPKRALFLLIAHNPGRLLPTIRSRCRRLQLSEIEEGHIAEFLINEDRVGEEEAGLIAKLATGSFRRALILANENGLNLYRHLAEMLAHLPILDIHRLHRFCDMVTGNEMSYHLALTLLRDWLHRRITNSAEPLDKYTPSLQVPLVVWSEIWEKLNSSVASTEALNLDRKQVFLSICMELRNVTIAQS